MTPDFGYMYRCLQLAKWGAGFVAPNPLVGSVLVYDGRIIGEGYHKEYGQSHAEVNCINSVSREDKHLIPLSTLYVSLEPCAHYGKTPPCSALIIHERIPKVIIGCRDPFKEVAGKGIEQLQNAGVDVKVGILEEECKELNKRFLVFHTQYRPYIILKWAQTSNGKIAAVTKERLLISNEFTNRLVHKWRGEEMGILVGTNTALWDNPELTNRLWSGKNPVRLIIDMHLRLSGSLKIFDQQQPTIIFNTLQHEENRNIKYYQVTNDVSIVHQILNACYQNNIQSIIVEGGARLLQSFIDEDLWDEARIITNETLRIENGLAAPELLNYKFSHCENIISDAINYYYNMSFPFKINIE